VTLDTYYYLDWMAISMSFAALRLLGNKSRWGFLCFVCANLCWLVVGWMAGSFGIVIGNALFLVMNTRGFALWKRAEAFRTQVHVCDPQASVRVVR